MGPLARAFAEPKAAHRLMLAIVALMVATSALWGERITAGGGLGWDGVTYAGLVRGLETAIRDDMLGSYYAQRILPAVLVRAALLLLGAALDDANIIAAFVVLNGVLCLALAELWRRICDTCALPVAGRWIGFTALFVNFQLSKQSLFYPVLTDVVALALSALLLLLYLKRRRLAVAAVGALGAFCWPTLALSAALLVLTMPRDRALPPAAIAAAIDAPAMRLPPRGAWIAAAFLAAIVAAVSPIGHALCTAGGVPGLFEHLPAAARAALARNGMNDPCLVAQQAATALPALALAALALLVLCAPLLRGIRLARPSAYRVQAALLALGVMAVSWLGVRAIANPAVPNPSGVLVLAKLVLLPQPGKLLLPLVSAAVFWGPFLVFLAIAWPQAAATARRLGPGIALVIGFTLLLGLAGEPRFLTTIWPILALLSALLLGEGRPRPVALALVAASFLFAQFWLPLNLVRWDDAYLGDLLNYPKQLYFMHYGLWMGWPAYLVQGALLAALAVWLWWRGAVVAFHDGRTPANAGAQGREDRPS